MADDVIPGELMVRVTQLARAIYEAGMAAGSEQMRRAILHAAQSPTHVMHKADATVSPTFSSTHRREVQARAPKGSLRPAIMKALSLHPEGLTEQELGPLIVQIDPALSPRSSGGELRRQRDRLYRADKGRWFLLTQPSEKESPEESENDAPGGPEAQATEVSSNGTPIAT